MGEEKRRQRMSSFAERFGNLTVSQVIELNNKAKETCAWEVTSQGEEV